MQVFPPPGRLPSVPAPKVVPAREDASWLGINWQGSSDVGAAVCCGVLVTAGVSVGLEVTVALGVIVALGMTVAAGVLDAAAGNGALATVGVEELQAESSAEIANTEMLIAVRTKSMPVLVRWCTAELAIRNTIDKVSIALSPILIFLSIA